MEYFCMTTCRESADESSARGPNKLIENGNAIEKLSSQQASDIVSSNYLPPTNQASVTQLQGICVMRGCHSTASVTSISNYNQARSSLSQLSDRQAHSPCLPVSKGNIKKMAQTRFVNSSPRSYRLMPASVESSDMTSFVEKSPHKQALRASFMLDVAELWELSKHSELECLFTSANTEQELHESFLDEAKQKRPICHSSVVPAYVPCPWGSSTSRKTSSEYLDLAEEMEVKESAANTGMDTDLLRHVKRFLRSQKLKEKHPNGIAGFVNSANSAQKCFYQHPSVCPRWHRKHKLAGDRINHCEDIPNDSLSPLVKLLSVHGPNEPPSTQDGQTFIIHMLPFTQVSTSFSQCKNDAGLKRGSYGDEPPSKKSRPTENMEVETVKTSTNEQSSVGDGTPGTTVGGTKSNYECFYCNCSFISKNDCARHMLDHLAAEPRNSLPVTMN